MVCGALVLCATLAFVGGPAFARYRCRSRQSEARFNLHRLHQAEATFHTRYGFYSSDLESVGWAPSGRPIYLYGFRQPGPGAAPGMGKPPLPSTYDERRKDTASIPPKGFSTFGMRDHTGSPLDLTRAPVTGSVSADRFLAVAVGDPGGEGHPLDVWTIDDGHTIVNLQDGCGARP